jgi:hypothetical protein
MVKVGNHGVCMGFSCGQHKFKKVCVTKQQELKQLPLSSSPGGNSFFLSIFFINLMPSSI